MAMSSLDEVGLGRRLQTARTHAGLTQQALCQRADLSYSTLTKIERGAIKSPSIFTIQSIAGALDLSLDELMGSPRGPRAKSHSKSGIRFVYFDINGCLVRFYHRAFTRLSEETNTPADIVETTFWHYNDQVNRGDITIDEFNKELARTLHIDSVDWLAYYLEAIEPIPIMHDLVHWASEHYQVGLLTNIVPGAIEAMITKGLIPNIHYAAIIDSSEVKAIKPEAKMYKLATEKANCPPAEILLVDDARINLMAAEKSGWHVLWFDDYRPDESAARVKSALEPA